MTHGFCGYPNYYSYLTETKIPYRYSYSAENIRIRIRIRTIRALSDPNGIHIPFCSKRTETIHSVIGVLCWIPTGYGFFLRIWRFVVHCIFFDFIKLFDALQLLSVLEIFFHRFQRPLLIIFYINSKTFHIMYTSVPSSHVGSLHA